MKKQIVKVFISLLLVVTLIYPCLVEITVSATTTPTYSTCADHHFSILNSASDNAKGSCGFIALSTLLSFYDSYWSDRFVAESFEKGNIVNRRIDKDYPNSVPALKVENSLIPKNSQGHPDLEAYSGFAQSNASDYLHLYLLSLAATQVKDDNGNYLINYQDSAYGINEYNAKKLLEYYLYNIIGFTSNQIVVHYEMSTGELTQNSTMYQSIRSKVAAGIPVYYGAQDITGQVLGHAMVAYAVTDNNDIKLFGVRNGIERNSVFTADHRKDVGIVWLEIKEQALPHSCCDHYTVWLLDGTTKKTCSCNAYKTLHPKHTHSAAEYESHNTSKHTYTCYCGASITAEHSYYRYSSFGASGHRIYCNCGAYIFESHFPDLPNQPKRCDKCGYFDDTYYQPWQTPDDPKDELLE